VSQKVLLLLNAAICTFVVGPWHLRALRRCGQSHGAVEVAVPLLHHPLRTVKVCEMWVHLTHLPLQELSQPSSPPPCTEKPARCPGATWQRIRNRSWDNSGWRKPQEISSPTPGSHQCQAMLLRALSHLVWRTSTDGGPKASETGRPVAPPAISHAAKPAL